MLREAVRCEIKLEAAGVVLCKPIQAYEPIVKSGLIHPDIVDILQKELNGEIVEFENEHQIRSLVDKHLPHSRLIEIVELAAEFDSRLAPEIPAESSPVVMNSGSRHKAIKDENVEHVGVEGQTLEGSEKKEERGITEEDKVIESLRGKGDQILDGKNGDPISVDMIKDPNESLTWPWWILEGTLLQTRGYENRSGSKDIWR